MSGFSLPLPPFPSPSLPSPFPPLPFPLPPSLSLPLRPAQLVQEKEFCLETDFWRGVKCVDHMRLPRVCVYAEMCVHLVAPVYMSVYVYILCVHVCTQYVCMYACTHTHTHTHKHTHTHTHTHTLSLSLSHTHTHTYTLQWDSGGRRRRHDWEGETEKSEKKRRRSDGKTDLVQQ